MTAGGRGNGNNRSLCTNKTGLSQALVDSMVLSNQRQLKALACNSVKQLLPC